MEKADKNVKEKENKSKRRKRIDELFIGYNGKYTPEEIDWGEPVGSEILKDE